MLHKFTATDTVPRHHTPSHSGRGPLHSQFFHRNLNFVENIFPCNFISSFKLWYQVPSNFCTCHDSTAVVSCAKVCSYHMTKIRMKTKWPFCRIWITVQKSSVKWVSEQDSSITYRKWLQIRSREDVPDGMKRGEAGDGHNAQYITWNMDIILCLFIYWSIYIYIYIFWWGVGGVNLTVLNTCHVGLFYFSVNKNIFIFNLTNEVRQTFEIICHGNRYIYLAQLQTTWWYNEAGHQEPWYWSSYRSIFLIQLMDSCGVKIHIYIYISYIHISQGWFTGTGPITRLAQH